MAVMVTDHRRSVQPKIGFLFLSTILLISNCADVIAGDWKFTPRVDSSLSYIDNIGLASAGNAESSGVFEVSPGFGLLGEGRRLHANIDYKLQSLFYSNNPIGGEGGDSKYFHNLRSSINSELVQRLLFIDASASVAQQSSSALGKSSLDNYSITQDRGTTSRYSLSPYFRHQIGNGLRSELRYRYDEIDGKKDIVNNAKIHTYSLAVNSGSTLQRWQWTLDAKSSDLKYDTQSDQTHYSGDFGVRYRAASRTILSAHRGTEKVKYLPNLGETGGGYWNVAMEWSPGKRSKVSMQAGERYYGRSYGLSLSHRTRHGKFGVDYKEDLTNRSFVMLESQISATPANGVSPTPASEAIPVLTNDIFLQKSLTAYLNWSSGKSFANLRLSNTNDDFQQSVDRDHTQSVEVSWRLRTSQNMTFNISGYYRDRELLPTRSKESLSQIEMTLSRNIWEGAKASASVTNTNLDADNNTLDYSQNRLSLAIHMHW